MVGERAMHRNGRRLVRTAAAVVVAAASTLVAPAVSQAATGTVYVRGTVTCPDGQPFAGAWVNSSGGKSGFATKEIYPGTAGRMAKVGLVLTSVTLPTTVSLNVGCGLNGTSWRYVYNGLGKVTASASGTVFINLGCTTTSCTTAPRGLAGSITVNPVNDMSQCTYRASAFWRQMAGSYPSWGGNAGWWDDNAPAKGWGVRGWAEPDSIMVWQPSTGGASADGHVGYVANTRVENGVTKVKIYDRNWDPTDRNGVWMTVPSGAKFIRVPPRFTSHNR
jgi:hypothetical protein